MYTNLSSSSVRRKEVSLSATTYSYNHAWCTLSNLAFVFCCRRVGPLLIQEMACNKLLVAVGSNHLLYLGLCLYQGLWFVDGMGGGLQHGVI